MPSRNDYFELRCKLLPFIADYPGSSKVLCMKGSGAICGCMKCNIRGEPCSADSKKKVYDGFRRFLPADHPWRRDAGFGLPEQRPAPAERTHADIVLKGTAADLAFQSEQGHGCVGPQRADAPALLGCCGDGSG
jgi:hypothetical protein